MTAKSDNKVGWDAEYYRKHSTGQQKWAHELIHKLALKGDERLLDIGCGDGRNTAEIASLLPEGSVLGLDYSKDMISLAQKTFPKDKYSNLDFLVCDALRMEFNSEFDFIFSNAALHWIKDHRTLLKRISCTLKPGGRILLQMGGRGNAQKIFDILDEMMTEEKWGGYFNNFSSPFGLYTPEEYMPWLSEAYLKPIRVELLDKDMAHNGREGFYGWIKSTWLPYTQRVPGNLLDEFINQAIDTYLKDNPADEKGVIHIEMKRLEVEAKKE